MKNGLAFLNFIELLISSKKYLKESVQLVFEKRLSRPVNPHLTFNDQKVTNNFIFLQSDSKKIDKLLPATYKGYNAHMTRQGTLPSLHGGSLTSSDHSSTSTPAR